MSQRIIGIDFGTYSLKVVYLERHVHELRVVDYFEQVLNHQSRQSHAEQVAEAVTQIFQTSDFEADVISMSVPGHCISSRVLKLPFTQPKKISEVVEFELENYVPVSIDELFYDHHILDIADQQSYVLCCYLQEERLAEYLDLFVDQGVDAKFFGCDFTDLAGIPHVSMLPESETYMICDIGHTKTNLLIMQGKELKYVRTLGVGGYHFTRVIQRAFNLNYEKAEALKLSRGRLHIREQDSDQVSRILDKVASELVLSIKQTLLGASSLYGQTVSVPAIFCCGGGSRLSGLLDYLSFHSRTNVFELECLNFVEHRFDEVNEIKRVIPQVLSTAIRPVFSGQMPRVNFRKGPYRFKQDIQAITNEFKTVAAMVVAIILFGIGYYFYADYHYSERMASVDDQVQRLIEKEYKELKIKKSKKRGKKPKLSRYLRQTRSRLGELKEQLPSQGQQKPQVVGLMYDISKNLPSKNDVTFEVTEFHFSTDFVRLNARTDDPLNVEKVVAALNRSKRFGEIDAGDPQAKPGNQWDFVLKINVK